jgi:hypothetical protein
MRARQPDRVQLSTSCPWTTSTDLMATKIPPGRKLKDRQERMLARIIIVADDFRPLLPAGSCPIPSRL